MKYDISKMKGSSGMPRGVNLLIGQEATEFINAQDVFRRTLHR